MSLRFRMLCVAFLSAGIFGCGNAHTAGRADASVSADASVDTDASPATDGGVGTDGSVETDASVESDASDGSFADSTVEPADAGVAIGDGERCETATLIGEGIHEHESTVGFHRDYLSGAGCTALNGPDRVYAVDVPAGVELTASVSSSTVYDPAINLIRGPASNCGDGMLACLDHDDSGEAGTLNVVHSTNMSTVTERIFILISSYYALPGDFSLTISFSGRPSGDACTDAIAITPGLLSGQTTDGFRNDFLSQRGSCFTDTYGPDRAYSIVVPAHQTLGVIVTPELGSMYDPSVLILPAPAEHCAGSDMQLCAAQADRGYVGDVEALRYHNGGDEALGVFVVVDTVNAPGGAFSLLTTLGTPPVGDICTNAPVIAAGALTAQSMVGFEDDYFRGAGCPDESGNDRAYAIDVPSGQRVDVVVTPSSGLDVTLSTLESLGACDSDDGGHRECADAANTWGMGHSETISYTNIYAAARRIFVVVDTAHGTGDFTISTTFM